MTDCKPPASRNETELCVSRAGLASGKALVVEQGERIVVVIETPAGVRAYIDRCPHLGVPLALLPGHVWSHDRRHLICATHGALFEPATGLCIKGPCRGQSLEAVAIRLID